MKRMIFLSVVVFVVLMIAWLWAGRTLTLAVDWMVPFPVRSLAASPLSYRGIDFHLGGERLTVIMLNHEHADLQVATDRQNRVVLSMGCDAFVLGPRTNSVDPKDPLNVDFAADSGDQVRLTAHESLLSWPNPFEVNWLGGSVARWKKYVYYWLVWTKPTGARLEMRWRYQRAYYQRTGWTEPLMMYNWHRSHVGGDSCGIEGTGGRNCLLHRADEGLEPEPILDRAARHEQGRPERSFRCDSLV